MKITDACKSRVQPGYVAIVAMIALCLTATSGKSADRRTEQLDELMKRFHTERGFHGAVLVAEQGEIIYQHAYGMASIEEQTPNSTTTRFWIASMSKQFTAAMIMLLVEEGKLHLDDHPGDFFSDYPESTGQAITIHQLLTHTSGIIQDDPLQGDFAENMHRPNTRGELRSYFINSDLLFTPGDGYQYSNYNYNLLAMIVENIRGKTHAENLQELIFNPVGMANSGVNTEGEVIPSVATGYEYQLLKDPGVAKLTDPSMCLGSGDIYSTVGDLYLWDQALYSERLLSDSSKQPMFTPYAEGYGYGWQIRAFPLGTGKDSIPAIFHDGAGPGHEGIIIRIPQDERLVVILSNGNEPWLHMRLARPKYEIAPAILAILYDREYQFPRRSAAYALAVKDTLSEDYSIEEGYAELRSRHLNEYAFDAEEFYCIGLCFAWDKKFQKTSEFLKIAVEELGVDHLPNAWQCHNVYGESLFMLGQIEPGCVQFERSLELKPDNSFALNALKAAEPYRNKVEEK